MAASYPASLPVKDPAGANLSTNPHSTLHDGMYDAIVALATELGTTPKGTAASVKARLDMLDIGGWTSWTPTVTQSGSVTVTNTRSRYARYGRTIHAIVDVTVTGSGTGANNVVLSLPVTAADVFAGFGSGRLYDVSATSSYPFVVELVTTTTARFATAVEVAGVSPWLGGASFVAGLASGDLIRCGFTYEAAS